MIAACDIPSNTTILDEEMSFQLPKAMARNSNCVCVPNVFLKFVTLLSSLKVHLLSRWLTTRRIKQEK